MAGPGYHDLASDWWPFAFILIAGWLPTDVWRWLGVVFAGRVDERSPAIALARAVATSLVAAVIARLILLPEGSLAAIPLAVRVSALGLGFAAYRLAGDRMIAGILVAEACLILGALFL